MPWHDQHRNGGHAQDLLRGVAEEHPAQRAGGATRRVTTPQALEFVSKVFWFSLEFGVVRESG